MDKEFFKTRNGTFIIIALIIAISYITVECIKISYKEKIRQENILKEEHQKTLLEACLDNAENSYFEVWNKNCKSLGKKEDCGLPLDLAKDVEKNREKEEKLCMEQYKNKAFRD